MFVGRKLLLTIVHFNLFGILADLLMLPGFLERSFTFDVIEKMLRNRRTMSGPAEDVRVIDTILDHALELGPNRSQFSNLYALAANCCVHKLPLIVKMDEHLSPANTVLSVDTNIAARVFSTIQGTSEGVIWLWSHGNSITLRNWVRTR